MRKHISVVTILVCLFAFISCNNEIGETQEGAQLYTEGEIITFDNGLTVQYKNGKYFWQGDIVLTQEQLNEMSSSTRGFVAINTATRWPLRTVPYKIDNSFTLAQQTVIKSALEHFNTKTCINIQEATSSDIDYVLIKKGNESFSHYGRIGGKQEIILKEVFIGTVCMYMLYTVGVLKEINRPDRDQYVTIFWENILEDKRHELDKYPVTYGTHMGVPFDLYSLTMPDKYEYSKNGQVTISGVFPIGQKTGLSAGDIKTVNKMYGYE